MRVAVLLSSHTISEAQRWKLVSSLFDQIRYLIESSATLLVTLAICASYTAWWGFWVLAGAGLVLTILRLVQWRNFVRAGHAISRGSRSPEDWARDYVIGICAMSFLWAATVASVTFLFRDAQLLMFVLLLQNAWLAGAGVRNAASPAAVMGQTLLTMVPTIFCAYFGTSFLVRFLSPACLIFMLVLLRIARLYGAQMLSLLESEQRLIAANAQLLTLSCTDGLTGLANRRAFDERFASEWAFAVREAVDIAIVLVDVDHFKPYNDHYGHLAGDDCLRAVASHVGGAVLRASDLPARYGGEEFVVLLPGTSDQGATEVGERLCQAIYDADLPHAACALGRVTISVGVASIAPGLDDLPALLLTRADQSLYKAKQGGRNRVCLAAPAHSVYAIRRGQMAGGRR
jgi:diguanylate cyclase (GGDEF)-like protein